MEVSVHSQPAKNVLVGTREPLLVYLHGLGEIGGARVEQVEKHGPWEHVRSLEGGYHADTRSEIARFHVLGFHLERGDWDGAHLNDRLRAYIADHPEVDSERIYLTGVSLGGRGVLRLTLTNLRISALAVFCPAGGDLEYSDTEIERFRLVQSISSAARWSAALAFLGTAQLFV